MANRLTKIFLHHLVRLASLVFLFPLAVRAADAERAEVEVTPVRVAHRTFDRAHPPPEMPPLKENEVALCAYQFGCDVDCQVESTRTLFKLKPARITKVKLILSLDITVWLPENHTEKMRAHEEGHREISETLYRTAPAIAQKWGDKAIGGTLQHSLKEEAAAQAELKQLQQQILDAYMQETAKTCDRAQTYYDSITAHGTNRLPEKTAVEQALTQITSPFRVKMDK